MKPPTRAGVFFFFFSLFSFLLSIFWILFVSQLGNNRIDRNVTILPLTTKPRVCVVENNITKHNSEIRSHLFTYISSFILIRIKMLDIIIPNICRHFCMNLYRPTETIDCTARIMTQFSEHKNQ